MDPIKEDNHYETTPLTLIAQGNQVIMIVNEQNHYLIDRIQRHLPYTTISSSYQFLFFILTLVTQEYFPILDEIDREKDRVNGLLRKQTTKRLLLELSDLETGLVYLLTASNQNVLVLEQLRKHPRTSRLTNEELEELEDALIEAQQLLAMTQLESQVLQQLSGAYDTILNNTLNENLTSLNIISILLAVLSLITGFFGMNVPLPLSEEPLAWIWISLAFIGLWLILARILRSIMNRR
ncbi:magnesium transporter CorA family protein [Streptococcus sp. NLN64]|uniref:magnesium transporter CorA family protein n=1 Tax=Streptococcus sp. NLN64 TaxID=2822799 RepID=UPI001FFD41AC|nr:magnesium transporter CorA family protein [Streptococcus sp. NLN64]